MSSVSASMQSLLEFNPYSSGTVRKWKSGTFRKQSDGSWRRVPGDSKTTLSKRSSADDIDAGTDQEPAPNPEDLLDPEVVGSVSVAMSDGYDHLTDEPARESTKDYINRVLDIEAAQTKDLMKTVKKIVKREKVTEEESDRAIQQLSDLLKVASLASITVGVGGALVAGGVGTAVAVAAVRGLRYVVTAAASNVVAKMWAKMRDKKEPAWDPLLPTGFYKSDQQPAGQSKPQAEAVSSREHSFLMKGVDAFFDSLQALKPKAADFEKIASLAVLQSVPQQEAAAFQTVSIRTGSGTVRVPVLHSMQEASVFQEVNAQLEEIVESLEQDQGIDLIFEALDEAGVEFTLHEDAEADDLVEAIADFIYSEEFNALDEEAQGQIKKGFKMVFGKLQKVGKGAGKLAGSIAKHTGKEMDKTVGRRFAKAAIKTGFKVGGALAKAPFKASAWATRKAASAAADSLRAAGGRQAYNIYKGVKKDMSK